MRHLSPSHERLRRNAINMVSAKTNKMLKIVATLLGMNLKIGHEVAKAPIIFVMRLDPLKLNVLSITVFQNVLH